MIIMHKYIILNLTVNLRFIVACCTLAGLSCHILRERHFRAGGNLALDTCLRRYDAIVKTSLTSDKRNYQVAQLFGISNCAIIGRWSDPSHGNRSIEKVFISSLIKM